MSAYPAPLTPAALRALAWRTLERQPSLQAALNGMGFVQADPIRAPARAQDLTLMQRVRGYRAGDLERLYPVLNAEEDMLPNYGFVTREVQALLHPREPGVSRAERQHPELLAEVRALLEAGSEVHPREVATALGQGRTVNAWGGQSAATTRLLDALHRRGEVRVTRRVGGIRLYGPAPHLAALRASPLGNAERVRGAVHLLAALYGPLPEASLGYLVSLSHYGLPHLRPEMRAAFKTAVREELAGGTVDGLRYVWPAEWNVDGGTLPRGVRIVGPFDPLVWDRRRFYAPARLDLPLRGVHAGGKEAMGLLRAARVSGGARRGLGQPEGGGGRTRGRDGLHSRHSRDGRAEKGVGG